MPDAAAGGRVEVAARLRELGYELPARGPAAKGGYTPAVVHGDHLYVSALGPFALDGSGDFSHTGVLGEDLKADGGAEAAAVTAVNLLAAAEEAAGLERLARIVGVVAYVNATPDFVEHVRVADGASAVLHAALGPERGAHTRTVVGASSLPFRLPIVISMEARLTAGAR